MTINESAQQETQPQQAPAGPDPALRQLDRFVGTWEMRGRTLESDVDNIAGQVSYEWLPGGFFFVQRIRLAFTGYEVQGMEVVGYDPESGTFPSTVYTNMIGQPLAYLWEFDGDDVKITTDIAGGATFHGRWSADGNTFSGGWRPNPGAEGPGNVAYDVSGGRAAADR